MPKIEDLTVSDNAGEEYTFEVYPKETEFENVAGVYLFTKRSANQHGARHKILYIGQTEWFKYRPLNYHHHKWASATRMGFTHICVLPTDNRFKIEEKLIDAYKPLLNERKG